MDASTVANQSPIGRLLDTLEAEAKSQRFSPETIRQIRVELERVEQQHAEFQFLVEKAPDIIARFDRKFRYQYVNPAIQHVTGKTPEQFIGKTHREMGLPGPLCDLWEAKLQEIFTTHRKLTFDFELPLPTGQSHWHQARLVPETNPANGQVESVVCVGRDITEQRIAEHALQASETRFRSLLEAAPDAMVIMDTAGRMVLVNQQVEKMFGYLRSELLEQDVELLLPQWFHARHVQHRQQYIAYPTARLMGEQHELFGRRKDGSEFPVEISLSPLQTEEGLLISSDIRDITERKRIEELVRESRNRLALALEAGLAGTVEWDLRTGKVHCNPRVFEIFGYLPNTVEPGYQLWRSRIHPDDLQRMDADLRRRIEQRERDSLAEYRIIQPAGETRWIRSTGRFHFDANGTVTNYIGVLIDITALKQAEIDMRRAKDAAEAANWAKDRFLATLSHELRTPLTPVLTAAQLMEADPTLLPEQRESASLIHRNVALETRLIDDLLDLTRITRGKIELHRGPVDLHSVLGHAMEVCSSDIRSKQLRLTVELKAAHHHVQGDAARLQQIFWNLLKNAVKFTSMGGSIAVRTAQTPTGRFALTIQDTGVGIEPELLPHIFNAFEQGGNETTRLFGGLGLGLAISKGLVELHGGTLNVHSEGKNKGATFTVELQTSLAAETSGPFRGLETGATPSRQGGCILLVEDHPDTAKMMARLLRRDGYEVRLADSVASALQAADAEPFDLVISDLGLPDGSGLDLMRQLSLLRPTRGIAMSGFGMEEDIQKSREAGFAAHLTKPVEIQQLEETVRKVRDA